MATHKSNLSIESILRHTEGEGTGNRRWSLKGAKVGKGIVAYRAELEQAHKPNPIIDDAVKPQANRKLGSLGRALVSKARVLQSDRALLSPQSSDAGKLKAHDRKITLEQIASLTVSARRIEKRLKTALANGNTDKAAKLAALLARQSQLVRERAEQAERNEQTSFGVKPQPPRLPQRPIITRQDQADALATIGEVLPVKRGHTFQRPETPIPSITFKATKAKRTRKSKA